MLYLSRCDPAESAYHAYGLRSDVTAELRSENRCINATHPVRSFDHNQPRYGVGGRPLPSEERVRASRESHSRSSSHVDDTHPMLRDDGSHPALGADSSRLSASLHGSRS
jgi:hypothetical protein